MAYVLVETNYLNIDKNDMLLYKPYTKVYGFWKHPIQKHCIFYPLPEGNGFIAVFFNIISTVQPHAKACGFRRFKNKG